MAGGPERQQGGLLERERPVQAAHRDGDDTGDTKDARRLEPAADSERYGPGGKVLEASLQIQIAAKSLNRAWLSSRDMG